MIINFFPLFSSKLIILLGLIFVLIFLAYFYFSFKSNIYRFLIFSLLILLALNPMINSFGKYEYNDVLILVSDKSQSITETNKSLLLLDAKEKFYNKIKDIEKLDILEIEIDNFKNKENNDVINTEIFTNLQNSLQKIEKERITGIIIITDGIIHDLNKISNVFSDIPIHFLLLGDKNERDRSIITKNLPEYALVGKDLNFLFKINDENFEENVKATFTIDGKSVLERDFYPNIYHEINLPVNYAGENLVEIKIEDHKDEISLLNNYKAIKVNGIHEKLRVMLISGEPNMGLRNWRNILNSDPSIELLHFTILRPPSKRDLTPVKELALIPFPSQELFDADLSKFNLIILDQYTLQGILPKKYLNNISNYVVNGGAILNISGKEYLSSKSLIKSPLSVILPTNPEEFYISPFLPTLTAAGRRHPITNSLKEDYKDNDWGKWFSFIITTKTAGKTLMEANNHPLLVISEISKGRIAQILSDQSWVWKKDQDNRGPLIKLLRNTIHWLLKTPEFQENFLKAERYKDMIKLKWNSLNTGNLSAIITTPNKKLIPITMEDNKNGNFLGKFKSRELGKFTFEVKGYKKEFYMGSPNNKEIERLQSSDKLIDSFFVNKSDYLYSKTWVNNSFPKIVRVYNKNNISGVNWIGLLEKKIQRNDIIEKKELFNWLFLMPTFLILLFFCWFRENR